MESTLDLLIGLISVPPDGATVCGSGSACGGHLTAFPPHDRPRSRAVDARLAFAATPDGRAVDRQSIGTYVQLGPVQLDVEMMSHPTAGIQLTSLASSSSATAAPRLAESLSPGAEPGSVRRVNREPNTLTR
jgi:hypothetical protein